jgi:hypothetical protein
VYTYNWVNSLLSYLYVYLLQTYCTMYALQACNSMLVKAITVYAHIHAIKILIQMYILNGCILYVRKVVSIMAVSLISFTLLMCSCCFVWCLFIDIHLTGKVHVHYVHIFCYTLRLRKTSIIGIHVMSSLLRRVRLYLSCKIMHCTYYNINFGLKMYITYRHTCISKRCTYYVYCVVHLRIPSRRYTMRARYITRTQQCI